MKALKAAGAQVVVVDGKLVTSRKPDDLKACNAHMIEVFGQGSQRKAA